MTTALRSNGTENTREMNIPLESKYWYFENNLFQQKFKNYLVQRNIFNDVL